MPSSYSSRTRFTLQATGENLATWGQIGNTGGWQLVDDAIAGLTLISGQSGTYTLSVGNGVTDEARRAVISVQGGTGLTITVPAVQKPYLVINGSAGPVTITCGGTTVATGAAGTRFTCYCDGSNVTVSSPTAFGGAQLKALGAPSDSTDAATKGYVDGVAFGTAPGTLPGQAGAQNQFITTDGTSAFWGDPLPSQPGNQGLFLTTDGTSRTGAKWAVALPAQSMATNRQVLRSNGTTAAWGQEGLTLIASANVTTAQASVDFTGLDASFDELLLVGSNVVMTSLPGLLMLRFSQGGTFNSTTGSYGYSVLQAQESATTVASLRSTSANGIVLGQAANINMGFEALIHAPAGTGNKAVATRSYGSTTLPDGYANVGGGQFKANTSAIDGVRVTMDSTTIASGVFHLYGLRKS